MEFVGREKKKKKRKNPQQKVHTPEDRTTMMIFCVYAKPVSCWCVVASPAAWPPTGRPTAQSFVATILANCRVSLTKCMKKKNI
jgi:hypothetical protein